MREMLSAAVFASATVLVFVSGTLAAQCTNTWLSGPVARPDNNIRAAVSWDPDGPGPLPRGVAVGGAFLSVGGVPMRGVALLDPGSGTWTALPGMPPSTTVRALAVLPGGDLVAGGQFVGAGGVANFLARWNGAAWTAMGAGLNNRVESLLVMPDGDLVVGGAFTTAGGAPAAGVARWDGTNWSPMPGLGPVFVFGMHVLALAARSNGDIVAGGAFDCSGGGNLAVWNGTGWNALTAGGLFVESLVTLADDRVAIGVPGSVTLWDGSNLQAIGYFDSNVRTLAQLPDGDLVAAGDFLSAGTTPAQHIARWSGASWSAFGQGVGATVSAIAPLENGDLMVVGGSTGSAFLMERLSTTCAASVASYGTGCAGSGGLDELAATSLPWTGSTFRAEATGMPASALVLSVYGFTQLSIPFSVVLPAALPGCTVLMSGDLIDVLLPNAGSVQTAVALPDDPSIVGGIFHHYVVPFEIGPSLQVLAITNSNALTCTVGSF